MTVINDVIVSRSAPICGACQSSRVIVTQGQVIQRVHSSNVIYIARRVWLSLYSQQQEWQQGRGMWCLLPYGLVID